MNNNIKYINIMRKVYLLFATAAMLAASCANDEFSGDNSSLPTGDGSIAFNMNMPAISRGGDAETDHGKLNDAFFVWGEKNETASPTTATTAVNLVFKNYKVTWGENTKNTTLSNTKDWEYVGVTPVTSNLTPQAPSSQTIKYWDMNAESYTFTAVSAKSDEVSSGTVSIAKTETGNNVYKKGYAITLKKGASTGDIYFADRVNIAKTSGTTTTNEEGKFGGYVKFTFRNFQTKIRFGFYETVPGYKVQVKNVTYNSTASTTNFGVNSKFYSVPTDDNSITYNVVYEDGSNGTTANKATVEVGTGATAADYKAFGGAIFKNGEDTVDLGTTSSNPTYDLTNGAYTSILPNPANDADMTFKISYTLISEDTGEKIEVTDNEVVVPVEYCKWKPNYAYTYLFKISDQSAGLYPITFDAMVVADETGKQETITELGVDSVDSKNTSITTFAYDATNKKIVESNKDEYPAGSEIYATVMEGSSNITLNATSGSENIKLYTVTTTDAAKYPVTERSVAKALDTATYPVAEGATKTITVTEATGATVVESVPAEDGVGTHAISALKWTDANTTTTGAYYYAIQYKNTANEYCYKVVKVVK